MELNCSDRSREGVKNNVDLCQKGIKERVNLFLVGSAKQLRHSVFPVLAIVLPHTCWALVTVTQTTL